MTSGPGTPRPALHIALTLIVFGSILIGHPFTESYARHTTPKAVWNTPQFHALNRRISAVWGLAFLAGTISLLIAGSVGDRQVLLRVIVPFGALYLAYRYSQKQARPSTRRHPTRRAGRQRLSSIRPGQLRALSKARPRTRGLTGRVALPVGWPH